MNLAAEPQFPTKWPFPPAPPARRGWGRILSPFRTARGNGCAAGAISPSMDSIASAAASAAVPRAGRDVTVRQMVVDILLVAMWGAMIPALMWLGAAAGF